MVTVFKIIESGEHVSIAEFEDDRVPEAIALVEVLYEDSGTTHFVRTADAELYCINEDGILF